MRRSHSKQLSQCTSLDNKWTSRTNNTAVYGRKSPANARRKIAPNANAAKRKSTALVGSGPSCVLEPPLPRTVAATDRRTNTDTSIAFIFMTASTVGLPAQTHTSSCKKIWEAVWMVSRRILEEREKATWRTRATRTRADRLEGVHPASDRVGPNGEATRFRTGVPPRAP
jgi:hypothetical protein